jgi:hypothetical protein
MKALKLCLFTSLLGCLPAVAAVPVLPELLVGSYQALLYTGDEATGTPAGLVTLTTLATGKVTGKLTTDENKTYSFTNTFGYAEDTTPDDDLVGTATVAGINIPRSKLTPLSLSLTILNNTSGAVLKVSLAGTGADDDMPLRVADSGFRNVKFAPKIKADWEGKYTLALEGADDAAAGEPQGHGYATGAVAATGILKLAGKTGDGVAFTAALSAGPNRNYVAYINPYKTATSFLAGKFTLVSREPATGFHVVAAETGVDFQWRKAAKATDKAYPAGFGIETPIGLLATMEPWAPLLPKQTLAQAYGMGADDVFNIAFSSNFNTTTYASKTPTKLGLNDKNAFYVGAGAAGSPSAAVPANWAKIFTIKVAPATGVLTGTLTITDYFPPPGPPTFPPKAGKTITRKLTIAGVMLRPATIGAEAFAVGSVTIPPIDPKTSTAVTAAFTFSGPYETAPLVVSAAAIAGSYTGIFDLLVVAQPGVQVPSVVPADDATVIFSVAAGLKSMVFNGRTVPLLTDGRPGSITFMSSAAPRLVVSLTVDYAGNVTKCDANYFTGPSLFGSLSRNNPQSIVKLP